MNSQMKKIIKLASLSLLLGSMLMSCDTEKVEPLTWSEHEGFILSGKFSSIA